MLKKIQGNLKTGVDKIKWFSRIFSERLKIEISVIKLLYRSEEISRKRDELLREIGNRVYELKAGQDKNPLRDRVVIEALNNIEKLEKDMDDLHRKVSEMSGTGS